MRALVSAILVAFAVMPMAVHAEDSAIKQIAARVELHAIPSLTLSDQQFLAATPTARPLTSPASSASLKDPESFPW